MLTAYKPINDLNEADGEQKVAQKGLQEQQPFRLWCQWRLVGGLLEPVQHGDAPDAKAHPGQQEHGQHGRERFGERHITAYQRHAEGQAQIGERAAGRRRIH